MKYSMNYRQVLFATLGFVVFSIGCSKKEKPSPTPPSPPFAVNANPTWKIDARCFTEGAPDTFDDLSVKDPSVVYFDGKYHLFYTARNKTVSGWQMGYVSASQISQLNTSTRSYMSALNGGSYFCAPEVFWFSSKINGIWFIKADWVQAFLPTQILPTQRDGPPDNQWAFQTALISGVYLMATMFIVFIRHRMDPKQLKDAEPLFKIFLTAGRLLTLQQPTPLKRRMFIKTRRMENTT
jgi:hypothetical protein